MNPTTDENHRLSLEGSLLLLEVWRRADLSMEHGAELAERMRSRTVPSVLRDEVREVVVDLSLAPPSVGPRTEASLAAIAGAAEKAGKPITFLFGEQATLRLFLQRLVGTHAARHGRVERTRPSEEVRGSTRGAT